MSDSSDPRPPPRAGTSSSASSSSASPPPPAPTDDPAPAARESLGANARNRSYASGQPTGGKKGESWREMQQKNVVSKHQDPCKFASDQVRLCLDMHDFDQSKCKEYFQAYRDCKDNWNKNNKTGITTRTWF